MKPLTLRCPNYYLEFQQCGPSYFFFRKYLIFLFKKQPLNGRSLGETNIRRCQITCRFELVIGPGTEESVVEFNPILAQ